MVADCTCRGKCVRVLSYCLEPGKEGSPWKRVQPVFGGAQGANARTYCTALLSLCLQSGSKVWTVAVSPARVGGDTAFVGIL